MIPLCTLNNGMKIKAGCDQEIISGWDKPLFPAKLNTDLP